MVGSGCLSGTPPPAPNFAIRRATMDTNLAWCRYILTRIALSENVADIHKLAKQALADTDDSEMGDDS